MDIVLDPLTVSNMICFALLAMEGGDDIPPEHHLHECFAQGTMYYEFLVAKAAEENKEKLAIQIEAARALAKEKQARRSAPKKEEKKGSNKKK